MNIWNERCSDEQLRNRIGSSHRERNGGRLQRIAKSDKRCDIIQTIGCGDRSDGGHAITISRRQGTKGHEPLYACDCDIATSGKAMDFAIKEGLMIMRNLMIKAEMRWKGLVIAISLQMR